MTNLDDLRQCELSALALCFDYCQDLQTGFVQPQKNYILRDDITLVSHQLTSYKLVNYQLQDKQCIECTSMYEQRHTDNKRRACVI